MPMAAQPLSSDDLAGAGAASVSQMIANTRNIDAQTQNLQAQRQGIIADSATKARDLAFQQWMGQNSNAVWDDTGTSPDHGVKDESSAQVDTSAQGFAPGSGPQPSGQSGASGTGNHVGPNGQTAINYSKVFRMMSDAGYGDKTNSVIQSMNDSIKGGITNATNQLDLDKQKTMGVITAGGIAAQAADMAAPGQKAAAYNFHMQNAVKNGWIPQDRYTPMVEDDFNTPNGKGSSFIKSAFAATITPKDAVDQSINRENANSAQLNANTNRYTQQGNAEGSVVASTQHQQTADLYEKGAVAAKSMPPMPNGFDSWAMDKKAVYFDQNPDANAMNRYMQMHNQDTRNIGAPLTFSQGPLAIYDALHADARFENGAAQATANVAIAGGRPVPTPTHPGPVHAPTPLTTTLSTVKMTKDGVTHNVSTQDQAAMGRRGWTVVK